MCGWGWRHWGAGCGAASSCSGARLASRRRFLWQEWRESRARRRAEQEAAAARAAAEAAAMSRAMQTAPAAPVEAAPPPLFEPVAAEPERPHRSRWRHPSQSERRRRPESEPEPNPLADERRPPRRTLDRTDDAGWRLPRAGAARSRPGRHRARRAEAQRQDHRRHAGLIRSRRGGDADQRRAVGDPVRNRTGLGGEDAHGGGQGGGRQGGAGRSGAARRTGKRKCRGRGCG